MLKIASTAAIMACLAVSFTFAQASETKPTKEERKAERVRLDAEQKERVGAFTWQALDGAGITAALTDQRMTYPNWTGGGRNGFSRYLRTQTFSSSGHTGYVDGRPSSGEWEVRGDQYCSIWPPSNLWSCYDVWQANEDAAWLRFIGEDKVVWDGEVEVGD